MNENLTDAKIYNNSGEHVGYIDLFNDVDILSVLDPDDTTKLIIYLSPQKA